MDESYLIIAVPIFTLGAVYAIAGFEFSVVMGLGLLIGTEATDV